ncbi:hypothetical protein [Streptomyces sp. NPDC002788]
MGERQSDGGLPGRGFRHPRLDADIEALIVACLVRDGVDAEAEQRAVAAFRAARAAGALHRRGHHRDDWRPRERRFLGRSLKTTLSVLLASLTLGGVAVAAIGAAGSSTDGGTEDVPEQPPASSGAPREPGTKPPHGTPTPGTGEGSAPARPAPTQDAQDTEAYCRAYEQVDGRGRAMDATAWQRLVSAAGGERNVTAYCAEELAESKQGQGGGAEQGRPAGNEGSSATNKGADQGKDESTGKSRSDGKRSQPNGRNP